MTKLEGLYLQLEGESHLALKESMSKQDGWKEVRRMCATTCLRKFLYVPRHPP